MLSMELQLGLALPVHSPMIKGFDLNDQYRFEPDHEYNNSFSSKSKRSFEEAFGKNEARDQLVGPNFLVWDGQPNEEDDRKGHKKRDSHPINKSESDEESHIIGWPPIKSSRKKELLQHNGTGRVDQIIGRRPLILTNEINGYSSASILLSTNNKIEKNHSIYVKVKMEGKPIARKIDLAHHHNYHSLKNSIITMFSNYDGKWEDSESYTLTYQDKEGDWLLAGDVPWKSFIKSAQRLEIVRNGG